MSDGVMLPLGEICRNASRRFAPPEDGKVWFINTGDVESGRFTHNDLSDWEGLPGQAKKAVVEGDILYSEIRPGNGRYAFVDKQYPNAVVSTKFMVIEAGESILPKYLYHVITSPELQNAMKLIAESRSGTFPQITFDSIAHLELMVPSKAEQLAVSSLLDAIEGRIRNNQKMNQTLEDIAKAIFKSWFVDFDPVRAKAEGRPTGLPPEISDLFPNELVDSEIGEMPKGWVKTQLDEIAEVIDPHPSHRAPKAVSDGYPFAGIGDIDEMGNINLAKARIIAEEAVTEQEQTYRINESSVGFGRVGTVGKVVRLRKQDFRFAISPTLAIVNPRAQDFGAFVYLLLKSQGFQRQVENNMTGSTRPAIGIKVLRSLTTALPEQAVKTMQVFQSLTQSMLLKGDLLNSETQILSELRDTLLPKLISGELRIPDAEKFLEEAGI